MWIFLILFIVGIMAIPVTLDIIQNGRNNILVKSYNEFVTLPNVALVIRLSKSAKKKWFK